MLRLLPTLRPCVVRVGDTSRLLGGKSFDLSNIKQEYMLGRALWTGVNWCNPNVSTVTLSPDCHTLGGSARRSRGSGLGIITKAQTWRAPGSVPGAQTGCTRTGTPQLRPASRRRPARGRGVARHVERRAHSRKAATPFPQCSSAPGPLRHASSGGAHGLGFLQRRWRNVILQDVDGRKRASARTPGAPERAARRAWRPRERRGGR